MGIKSTKDIGRELELYIVLKLREIDSTARLTRGSGCGNEIGDVSSKYFYIEAKKRNTISITIHDDVWQHLLNQMPLKTNKIPFMVHGNSKGRRWATLDFDDFIRILKRTNYEDKEN